MVIQFNRDDDLNTSVFFPFCSLFLDSNSYFGSLLVYNELMLFFTILFLLFNGILSLLYLLLV